MVVLGLVLFGFYDLRLVTFWFCNFWFGWKFWGWLVGFMWFGYLPLEMLLGCGLRVFGFACVGCVCRIVVRDL